MRNYLIRRIPVLAGAGIGAIVGLLVDNLPLFVAIGAGLGLLFAIAIGGIGRK
ncbi:hypothetical protein ACFLT2_04250 [Acidobacteriota bacterium]